MQKYDFVVLGAGLAGLAFAKRVSENGSSVLLLEKEILSVAYRERLIITTIIWTFAPTVFIQEMRIF